MMGQARIRTFNGVPGNLLAFAGQWSFDKGYAGFVSKHALIEHNIEVGLTSPLSYFAKYRPTGRNSTTCASCSSKRLKLASTCFSGQMICTRPFATS